MDRGRFGGSKRFHFAGFDMRMMIRMSSASGKRDDISMGKEEEIARRIADWIGDSVVVNDDGTPKAVVHVSEWNGEGEFKKEYMNGGRLGKVFYFSDEPDFSYGRYAREYYLKIERPFYPDKHSGRILSPDEANAFGKAIDGVDYGVKRPIPMMELVEGLKNEDNFGEAMKAIGYDGIIVDGIYGVFDQSQIMKAD